MDDDVREKLAEVSHEIWSHWMKYMFECGKERVMSDLTFEWVMPEDKMLRWQRQMRTPYNKLTEQEKESDRNQADKKLAAIKRLEAE